MISLFSAPYIPRDPDDEIVPLHFFDDTIIWRSFILYSTFVFDCVLDADKLRSGLERLVCREGWWKLGSRLRKSHNGNLEYHVPKAFTVDRPGLTFSHVQHNIKSSEHELAARLPRATAHTKVLGDPNNFDSLVLPAGAPKKLDDYLNSDRPQLGLHTVTFYDMTIITVYFPHTLMDAMGQKELLNSWCLILSGEEDKVKTPYGTVTDPLSTLGMAPGKPYKLASRQLGIYGLVSYGLGQVINFMRKSENRMVCVPASVIKKLHETAMVELATTYPQNAPSKGFLTEGDVLCAWWTRILISRSSCSPNQTITLNNAFDMRKVLRGDLIPEKAAYVSNAIGFINVLLSAKDVLEKPLAHTALAIRSAINELGTREQVDAFFEVVRRNPGKLPPFFGDRYMHMITFSNWSKTNLYQLDFSAAIMEGCDARVAKPRYIQNTQSGLALPNAFPIIGKDCNGNYWLSGLMNMGHWADIETALAKEI